METNKRKRDININFNFPKISLGEDLLGVSALSLVAIVFLIVPGIKIAFTNNISELKPAVWIAVVVSSAVLLFSSLYAIFSDDCSKKCHNKCFYGRNLFIFRFNAILVILMWSLILITKVY